MYNSKQNTIHVPFVFKSSAKMAEEKALLDSRATHNFMNKKMAKRLGIGTRKLKTPQLIKMLTEQKTRKGRSPTIQILNSPPTIRPTFKGSTSLT
jgi:hypothetical protein